LLLRSLPNVDEELVEVAGAGDGGADVAGVDGLPGLDEVRDPARLEEFGCDLGVGGLARRCLVGRKATLLHHPLDEAVQLRQRLGRRVDDERLEALPLALPLVPIESGFDHDERMRRRTGFETLRRVKVLVAGSGGREHALAWQLAQSERCDELHAAPGNPGIAKLGRCHPVRAEDPEGLLAFCSDNEIDLVVIGPEAPLVAGVADHLRHAGVAVFGPSAEAARIEGSKAYAKEIMAAAGVPTGERLAVARPPCVIKIDGLAAGKGVFICRTEAELDAGLRAASAGGDTLVIEELLEGEEVSLFAVCDGREAVALAPAQDFKRIGDGDTGPNTGGMGAYSPVPKFGAGEVDELLAAVHQPVLTELARRGTPFVGLLYAGLMLTERGPRVLEFNCRFGDPETQSILPRLEGDLLETLYGAATGKLGPAPETKAEAAVTVVLAAAEYPDRGDSGSPIHGIDDAEAGGALVFHAGTAMRDGALVTNGGRILNVTSVGTSVAAARATAYEAVAKISFPGMRYRRDIAERAGMNGR
jgi:phosphoribosylamine---glycine ligase